MTPIENSLARMLKIKQDVNWKMKILRIVIFDFKSIYNDLN